jgi:predicted ferric reductase
MHRYVYVLLAALSAAWISSQPLTALLTPAAERPWEFYVALLHGSGYLSATLMSVAMLLALRGPRLEALVGGLDQLYRVHRQVALLAIGLGATPLRAQARQQGPAPQRPPRQAGRCQEPGAADL